MSFSPNLINVARVRLFARRVLLHRRTNSGHSGGRVFRDFISGRPVGAVVVGGSAASNPQAQIGLAGSNNGSNLPIVRNLYTYEDRVTWSHGPHQWSFGAWFQHFQSNETINLSQFGQATFTSLQTFLDRNDEQLSVSARRRRR